ncbi:hypothetical protein SB5439_05112 [Klebsiella variicola]|uniref:hypothetical protein n=1 Tax=Klebsiella variicola TaxID=244366 RepID=UPI00109CFF6A|nr:hypothetical protein [Klebsiella variicola]VGQ12894.1 hypothetical protein SB5439_05112 [Klebsiella variicola]
MMIGLFNIFKGRGKPPKLSKAERKALLRPRNTEDNLYDAIEAFNFLTNTLIGAMVEEHRDPEAWCRRVMRDALIDGSLRRFATKELIWQAQRKDSAFEWMRERHKQFLLLDRQEEIPGMECKFVDFDQEVPRNT